MLQNSSILTPSALLTAAAALAAVLLLVWLAGRTARAGGFAARPSQRLQLRAALQIDGKRRLHVVACDGRELLVLTGGSSEQVVGWLPQPYPSLPGQSAATTGQPVPEAAS